MIPTLTLCAILHDVGQTECVQLINSYFSLADLRYYTEPQGELYYDALDVY